MPDTSDIEIFASLVTLPTLTSNYRTITAQNAIDSGISASLSNTAARIGTIAVATVVEDPQDERKTN